ncbi:putative chemosensory receptor 1 [Danaus plexippus plexippus]|uniref:Chemosensory receptor 1 n=1 Tax=Danaus plexippus plexippus TaxID=278856 RepID=A0A212FL11_DANPL|nr:putative chemosensory receptor 1 [Danaus plexippus plexippus]
MTCITMAMFLRVATLWPKLVRHITAVEESDPNYDTSLNRKCNVTCHLPEIFWGRTREDYTRAVKLVRKVDDVQRFLDQVTGDKIALTGLQFFRVTRKLLLNIAGTIVTYELVMFQFDTTTSNELGTPFPSTNLMNNRSFQRSNLTG